jgi:NDP-4-keto-2,6-dideoxyhexose 3-C-methyltransferase
MREALADVASKALRVASPNEGDIVIDTGCNDGTLLRSYSMPGLLSVGFEPAENLIDDARKGTGWIFNDFFKADVFQKRFGSKKAKIITSVAMFYDLDDPNSFTADAGVCLAEDGIWVIQQNYLVTMLEKNGFDNIGHEHLEYYSLETMENLVMRNGLEIFEVETNEVNGGSFRTYVGHPGKHPVGESVKLMRKLEGGLSLNADAVYRKFASNIERIRLQLRTFVMKEVKRGKKVYAYGASNRGNTILQYCGLDHRLIGKAADANREKWGLKTVGTQIPIVSKEEARKDNPDYFLVLPHHFIREIEEQETAYLNHGGKLLVPLPKFRILRRRKSEKTSL